MNKKEVRSTLDALLSGKHSVVELSDKRIRSVLMYLVKFHGKTIAQAENQTRRQNG
jgi:hypothetical protein